VNRREANDPRATVPQMSAVKLTSFSHGAGCACKLGSDDLDEVLCGLRNHPAARHPDLVVGIESGDDAAVIRLDGRLLVQTVDFFTPIVDDACDWGRIAAANALSDVYAMGGRPLSALQVVAWPRGALPFDLLGQVIDGGASICEQAGCVIAGGHSVDDPEPKYGLAVTGIVEEDRLMTNRAARPGDQLILTKPIGSGVVTTGLKRGEATSYEVATAVEVMVSLNAAAAEVLGGHRVEAATDVTGFGLLGHLAAMMRASGTSAMVRADSVPELPGARRMIAGGVYAGGSRRNLESAARFTEFGSTAEEDRMLLADAQTSGGLLAAVAPAEVDDVLDELTAAGTPAAALIGEVTAGGVGRISVE
jgi:selenide, water dikinase